jgi:serine/threonine protein kinase
MFYNTLVILAVLVAANNKVDIILDAGSRGCVPLPTCPEYTTIHSLDRGGQSRVFLADMLGEQVVIKHFRGVTSYESEKSALECLPRLEHMVQAKCAIPDEHSLALEYVDGNELSRRNFNVHILWQLTSTLEAIHKAGYVHGDLKPNNILVAASRRAVIIDFGLSRPIEELRGRFGTPPFMAPEMSKNGGKNLNESIDWYSLGKIITTLGPQNRQPGVLLMDFVSKLLEPNPKRRKQLCRDLSNHGLFLTPSIM